LAQKGQAVSAAATERQIADAVVKLRRSQTYRRAAERLDMVAVCLIGYAGPVPIRIGDNTTPWPVRIVVTREPETVTRRSDLEHPLHELTTLAWVWTESEAHARRLKAAIDEALLGADPIMVGLRHSWRDIVDEPLVKWGLLLDQALRALRHRGEVIRLLSDQMRDQRIVQEAQRGVV